MFDMYDVYRGPSVDRDVDEYRKKFIQMTHDTQIQARQCILVKSSDGESVHCQKERPVNACTGLRSLTKACRMA